MGRDFRIIYDTYNQEDCAQITVTYEEAQFIADCIPEGDAAKEEWQWIADELNPEDRS